MRPLNSKAQLMRYKQSLFSQGSRLLFFALFFGLSACSHSPSKELSALVIPVTLPDQTHYQLDAIFLQQKERAPLVVLTHGAPGSDGERVSYTPEAMLRRGKVFHDMGFAVLLVERRGYGRSPEKYVEGIGPCEDPNYVSSGARASEDILGAVVYAKEHLPVDANKIVLVGQSAGGFSSIFASSYRVPGVMAVLNFAGGRGSGTCRPERLVNAFGLAGMNSRIATLWVYAANDSLFPPPLAQRMFLAFHDTGGKGELRQESWFGDDGHYLFSDDGIRRWKPIAKQFLEPFLH